MPLERSRSNDSRHDDEYSIRDEYCDDLRDNNDDYSTIADYSTVTEEEKSGDFGFSTKFFPFPTIADYSTVTEEEKPDDFGFSTKFFCCDSTMSWGFRLGKEDEDTESEKNVKRGIIPHFPQRGRSLARTDPFPRGRGKSLSRTDERRGRSHSRSRSFYGAKSTSSAKKFKGLFSNLSRKKASTSNKEIAPSIPPTNICDASDSSSLAKAEIERLKSQLTDLKKAEEERRRQAELLEAATNATDEGEKRNFAEAAALAAEAATKALDDEETKRAAGALLAHQMEEDETNVDKETAENNTSNVSAENGSEGTSTDLDMKAKLRSLRTILSSKCCIDDVQDAIDKIISSSKPIDQKDAETTDDIAQDVITKRVISNEPIDLLDGPPSELNRERSDVTTSDTSASIRIHSDCHATELQLASADDNSILEEVVAAAGVEEAVDVGTGIDERDVAAGGSIDRGGRDVAMQEEGGRQQTANRKRSDSSTSDTSTSIESENSFVFVDGSYTDGLSLDNEDVHDEHPLVTLMDKTGGVKLACDPFPFIDCVDDAAFHSVVCSPCRGCFDEQSQSDEQCQSSVSEVSASGEGRGRLRSTSPNAADDSERPTLLAVEAATKALDDEETKWAAGALLAHQMEEDHEAGLDQNKQEDEDVEDEEEGGKFSPDTTISKDSTKVETNVKKETAENNTSNVSTENGSEGTDSEQNEYQEKKASELKEKKRKEEAAREKKASELKEKKRKEEAAREKKASELKEKKAAQKVRREYPHLFLVSALCRSRYFVSRPNTIHSTAFLSFLLPKGAQTDGRQGEEGQEAFKERAEEESSKAGSD